MSDQDTIRPDRSKGDGIAVDLRDGGFAIFSHGPNAMSLFEPDDGRILEVNDAWVALYGYTREQARTMRVQDVSAEPGATSEAVRRAEVTGGARVPLRWHRNRAGEVFPVDLTSGTLRFGARVLMYAVMRDISGRVQAEEALLRSEARFRTLIEKVPVGIVVHRGGRVVYTNPCFRAMVGLAADRDVVGTPVMDLVHPDDRERVRERVRSLTEHGTPAPMLEERVLRYDGGPPVWVEATAAPFEFDGAPAALAMIRDVRERKRMEAQLVLADRLASLGRLAASVGHEINNPLAYVLGNVQLVEREVRRAEGLDPPTRAMLLERLAVLEEGAARVRDIVRDLKTLSGGEQPAVVGPVDLHRVLDVCANMAAHEVRHRARLVRDYGPPAWVRASEARLGQVFLNLLVNAAHAIPEGRAEDNEIRVATRQGGSDRVIVEVRDTGAGIASEHLDRIFEPFFTTKDAGGTGLGLSISHAIVTALGGTIGVEPVAPRGTCVRVTLPCAHDDALEPPPAGEPDAAGRELARDERAPSTPAPAAGATTPRPRVLVADDERALADTVRRVLDDCDVVTVHDGRAAIERLGREHFDVVLLDVRMDRGSGLDVMRWAQTHAPAAAARVVFMTGGSPAEIFRDQGDLEVRPVLHKPFDLVTLRAAIDGVLRPRA